MALLYDMKFAKSFSRYDQNKIGYVALFGCLMISMTFLLVVKPYSVPRPTLNLQLSMSSGLRMFMTENQISSQQLASESKEGILGSRLICNTTNQRSDLCEMKGDVRIHGISSKIIIVSLSQKPIFPGNETWKIRPYARKGDSTAMENVKEFSLKSLTGAEQAPNCFVNHSVPAIVFSIGGYAGNFFHDFSDILVPLFITSHQYHGEVQFIIANSKSWWISKYQGILKKLSKYKIIESDHDDRVHCFSNMLVGLRQHKYLSIDPSRSPNGYSMYDFTSFLRSSYSLQRDAAIRIGETGKKPRLLIISRERTRTFTNVGEIVKMARRLGYEVVVTEADTGKEISKFAHVVNSCDVMMGVHGAGLTNLVFLPTNAVLIQVVPFGGVEWVAGTYFASPSMDMKIKYLEYNIKENESTLIEQYPHDHEVLRDPISIGKRGWQAFKSVYLDKQNVKLDVKRFRGTLLKALELLHH
ncbi:hypothetical protein AAC387_Pa09g0618 [Persea americana]